jgi:hypothetical protein
LNTGRLIDVLGMNRFRAPRKSLRATIRGFPHDFKTDSMFSGRACSVSALRLRRSNRCGHCCSSRRIDDSRGDPAFVSDTFYLARVWSRFALTANGLVPQNLGPTTWKAASVLDGWQNGERIR